MRLPVSLLLSGIQHANYWFGQANRIVQLHRLRPTDSHEKVGLFNIRTFEANAREWSVGAEYPRFHLHEPEFRRKYIMTFGISTD